MQKTSDKEDMIISRVVKQDVVGKFDEPIIVLLNGACLPKSIKLIHMGLVLVTIKAITN